MRTNRRYALLVGALLLIAGVCGLSSPVLFGRITTNQTHAIIHIVLGVGGIWAAVKKWAGDYATFLGLLLLTVGALWFVPSAREFLVRVLNLNRAGAIANLAIGVISLLLAFGTRSDLVKR